MTPLPWQRYLAKHGVSGPWRLAGDPGAGFAGAVVIPALAEADSLPSTLASLAANPLPQLARWLAVVVVNHRADAAPAAKADNRRTLALLAAPDRRWPDLRLAWVDAAVAGRDLPAGEGVGLARKLGCDLALERLDWSVSGGPLLAMLDADTLVGGNYLPALENHFATARDGAATLPFCHQPGEAPVLEAAIRRYEVYLRGYLLGLTLAGSPYAYPTIGSTIACRATAYLRAGGMNRRQAGEDFYFLQQLAKTSGVAPLAGTLVRPAARLSERVPFGTGPALARQLAGDPGQVTCHPKEAFEVLRDWLALAGRATLETPGAALLAAAGGITPELASFLERLGLVSCWDKLRRTHRTRPTLTRAFHGWFDALQTRRLLHHLAAGSCPRAPAEQALPPLFAWAGLEPAEEISKQLALLRNILQNFRDPCQFAGPFSPEFENSAD
jgi:hypothetical protein